MNKVRAYWGHNYHFHIRIKCPAGDAACEPQDPVPPGDGCDKSLAWWFTDEALHPRAGQAEAADHHGAAAARVPDRSFWRNSRVRRLQRRRSAVGRVWWPSRSASARSSVETTKVRWMPTSQ